MGSSSQDNYSALAESECRSTDREWKTITTTPNQNDGKLDIIISELEKISLKIPDTLADDMSALRAKFNVNETASPQESTISSHSPKIDDTYSKLVSCKTVEDLCQIFGELSYIPAEKSLYAAYVCYILPKVGVTPLDDFLMT